MKDLTIAHLDLHVPVPAVNRWVKLYTPLSFWHVGSCLGYLPTSFRSLSKTFEQDSGVLNVDSLVGLEEDETYKSKRKARFTKASTWLNGASTIHQQSVGIATLKPLVSLMGRFFDEARFGQSGSASAMNFCFAATSPAHSTINRYFELLGDPDASLWLPVRGPHGWEQRTIKLAAVATYFAVGAIYHRLVRPFSS
jgi:hypothetical protein